MPLHLSCDTSGLSEKKLRQPSIIANKNLSDEISFYIMFFFPFFYNGSIFWFIMVLF